MNHEAEYTHDTDDIRQGIAWWNGLTPEERRLWLERVGSAIPADAWVAYKREIGEGGQ